MTNESLPLLHPLPDRIETARLVLRPWAVEDAPKLKAIIDANLDHLRAWMPWAMNEPSPVETIAERIEMFRGQRERGEDFNVGVLLGDEGIGGAGLHRRNGPGVLEIGYWIAAAHVRRGYATEAAAALSDLAFAMAGIERVEIRCDPRNVFSAAVPRKLGFVHTTTLEANTVTPTGEPRDTMVWEMTRSSWFASRQHQRTGSDSK
jgi:RimJ/RimL family protein N-acetyltransferase